MSTVVPEVSAALDLVNAALLGTDRRPVDVPEGTDPAGWLLQAAAGRRARTLVAAGTATVPPPAAGPAPDRPRPSAAARAVLDDLLRGGSEPLIDLWLREALAAGTGLAPEHRAAVLERSRRASTLDRGRIGAALGPDGLWFARHNPAWAAVVRAAEAPRAADADASLTPDATRREIAALASGGLAPAAVRAQGRSVGARLPLEAYAVVSQTGLAAELPSARAGLAATEEVLWIRWDLAHAFDPDRVPPERRPVPLAPDPSRIPPHPHAPQERP